MAKSFFWKRRNARRAAKRRAYKKNRGPRSRARFVRNVKKIVQSMSQDKQAYTSSGDSLIKFNSGIDSTGDMIQIVPYITTSVYDNGRIGEQIRAKSLKIKGFLKFDINDSTTDSTKYPSVIARLMVVSLKTRPCFYDATGTAATLATLLKKGGATVGFTGKLSDVYADINRDVFTVHYDKKFYLNQSYLNATGPSPPSTILSQDVKNSLKFFNINVKCKNKILKYDEDVGSDLLPTNFGPMLLLGYSYADGSAADVVSTPLGLQFDSMLTYEDA